MRRPWRLTSSTAATVMATATPTTGPTIAPRPCEGRQHSQVSPYCRCSTDKQPLRTQCHCAGDSGDLSSAAPKPPAAPHSTTATLASTHPHRLGSPMGRHSGARCGTLATAVYSGLVAILPAVCARRQRPWQEHTITSLLHKLWGAPLASVASVAHGAVAVAGSTEAGPTA